MESCNDFARNVIIFGVDNTSSSHTDNRKNNFLVLGEATHGINDSTGAAGKKISINFSKVNTKFCLSLYYNGDESYLYVNKTEICKFKTKHNTNLCRFCLGSVQLKMSIKK